MCCCESGEG
uniref:Uncharacterized protein n=1 Tax=Anguilla anguilla TaxID=7936 RepID=A0A0E9TFG1_ANGAN